jgi:N-acetylglucosamine malate deacetylase 1
MVASRYVLYHGWPSHRVAFAQHRSPVISKSIKRFLLRRFAGTARPYLEVHGLMRSSGPYSREALVHDPGGGRVLVLAPHMDDEIIGCGGAIARHAQAGAQIQVVFLTDGRYGSSALQKFVGEERKRKEMELVATRKEEARRALEVLGIRDLVFLDAIDGKLAEATNLAPRLREVLEKFLPDVVYLPCFLEQHPDHRAASAVLLEATRGMDRNFDCFSYEVWTPLVPNCFVEIDSVIELKKKALGNYQSQLADVDYFHTGLGLNAHRSLGVWKKVRFVEAYLAVGLAQYRTLYEAFESRR